MGLGEQNLCLSIGAPTFLLLLFVLPLGEGRGMQDRWGTGRQMDEGSMGTGMGQAERRGCHRDQGCPVARGQLLVAIGQHGEEPGGRLPWPRPRGPSYGWTFCFPPACPCA